LPWPPEGSVEQEVKGVRIWTNSLIDKAAEQNLIKLIDIRPVSRA